jgi:ABC-2 type transport system permease protein
MREPDAVRTRNALRGLRVSLVRNQVQSLLRGSRLRLTLIALCSAVFWAVLFALFFEGFQFLGSFLNATEEIVEYLFGIFFFSLLVMLVVSNAILLYNGLFYSREATYLLTLPCPDDRAFSHKFAESIAFSSWGFLLLGSPLMVAYGITVGADASYYIIFLAYLIAFVLISGSVGAMAAIAVANYTPRRAKTVLVIVLALLMLTGLVVAFRLFNTPGEALTRDWLDGLLDRLTFSQHPLLPSRWMSRGLVGSARGDHFTAVYYLGITAAHGGLAYLCAAVAARDLYRRGYSRVQGGRSTRTYRGHYSLDRLFHRLFGFLPHPIRLLILKDLRCFRRDPAQWSQFLIFFGLLAFYFLNIRRLGFGHHSQSPYWRNLLGLLNLGVTALILSTFTTRFIFPLLSLEGRNFWVLGLLPLRREAILWGKFAFAAGISLVATEALVILSDVMLGIDPIMVVAHVVMIAVLCVGLSAISVGLGACLPNLREDDPSKIAAGFGGTLNLLVSLAFIAVVVTSLAIPSRSYFASLETNSAAFSAVPYHRFLGWLALSAVIILVWGAIATIVPLRLGIRAFQRIEF